MGEICHFSAFFRAVFGTDLKFKKTAYDRFCIFCNIVTVFLAPFFIASSLFIITCFVYALRQEQKQNYVLGLQMMDDPAYLDPRNFYAPVHHPIPNHPTHP